MLTLPDIRTSAETVRALAERTMRLSQPRVRIVLACKAVRVKC